MTEEHKMKKAMRWVVIPMSVLWLINGKARQDIVVAAVFFMIAFVLVWRAPMIHFGSQNDPKGCLLTSQNLLQNGTVELSQYPEKWLQKKYSYKVRSVNGRMVYYFPIGSSIVALPAVAVANAHGIDMAKPADDRGLQRLLAALTCSLATVLVFLISRQYCAVFLAALQTAGFSLGSTLASTMGSAYWSHNTFIVFALLAVYMLVLARDPRRLFIAEAFALVLFLAYLCRPTGSVLVVLSVLYLLQMRFSDAIRVMTTLIFSFSIFVLFSLVEYHSILPPYYVSRLAWSGHFWTALAGTTLSPSRGIFVFSPFLLVPIIYFIGKPFSLLRDKLAIAMAGWFILHVIVVCNFWQWWGGYSFGPRLLTDVMPAFLILHSLYFQQLQARRGKAKTCLLALSSIFIVFSIWVNVYQGLYNTATARWNGIYDISQHPERLFEWEHAQIFASEKRNAAGGKEFDLKAKNPIKETMVDEDERENAH